jgi:hypothetical protein
LGPTTGFSFRLKLKKMPEPIKDSGILKVGNRLLATTDEPKAGNTQESEAGGRWLGNWRDIHLCII